MKHPGKKIIAVLLPAILFIGFSFGCVESLTDTVTSTTPSIEIFSPKTNDTIKVGKNVINFQATDGSGGQGLSFYELYINKVFVKRIEQNTDGTNPVIYLEVDSLLIYSRINYSLKVYNKTGKSKESKLQENIYVKDKEPKAPSNLILARISDFAVTLKWDDNSKNEKGFELWRKDAGNSNVIDYRKWKTLPVNTISFTDNGLSPYVDYSYKVRAFNESGPSEFSNEINTSSLPGGPWNLQAEAIGASTVHLKWVDFAVNEQGFQIERTNPFTNEFKVLALTGPNVSEYYDNSVSSSTGYSYRVAYFTLTTQSSYSNIATISTFYTDVSPPSDLSASIVNGYLELTWKDNSRNLAKGTVIERKTGANGEFIEIGSVSSDQNKFNDLTAVSGQTYFYRVRQVLGTKVYTPYSEILKVVL